MTPKEKAKELFEKFYSVSNQQGLNLITHDEAKQCALIAVQMIIDSDPTQPLTWGYYENYSDMINQASKYWQQVKTEIEAL